MEYIIIGVVAFIFLCTLIIRIVPQANAYVIEFLGSYKCTWGNGIHLLIPGFERIAKKVSLKEQVEDFPPQPVITKDNVTMQIDTVVYYSIFEPRLFTYGVESPVMALQNLTATTLRNIIGELELDQTLTSRDVINNRMQGILDEATDKWGIKVNRVELKNIIPPRDIQESMEKQMRAEREKRQTLLEAEAHKQSSITRAEGDKQAMILKAEAERDAAIARATGEAESIRLKYEAEANGLKMLNATAVTANVLTLKKLEALGNLGNGKATKIVVPTDLAKSAADLTFIKEMTIAPDADAADDNNHKATFMDACCDSEEKSKVTKSFLNK